MSLKTDLKFVAAACIFLGLFIGFYLNGSFVSNPKIETLESEVEMHLNSIESLSNNITAVQVEYENLENRYLDQSEEISQAQEEINLMEEENSVLDAHIESLTSSVNMFEDQIDELEDEYIELLSEYDRLEERFLEVNNPSFVAFGYENLVINLTVTKNVYEDNIPIEGKVTVEYNTGVSFEGTCKLRLSKVFQNVGVSSDYFEIYGDADYYWPTAFAPGPGSYKLSMSELIDDEGTAVIPESELKTHFISIFMG